MSEEWTEEDEENCSALILQERLEEVSPKFEEWRNPYRYKIAYGGRGAGAKSWSATSLVVQKAEYSEKPIRVLCTREVQKSIQESSWRLIKNQIQRLGYIGWATTNIKITNKKNNSLFVFNGLNDLSVDDLKSYEDFDVLLVEEAHGISYETWRTVLPTFRKKGSEIWALFNRQKEIDPVYDLFVLNERPNSCVLWLEPGPKDNPWWYETTLQEEMEEDYRSDPEEALHIWGGLPRSQGSSTIFRRSELMGAALRDIEPEGKSQIGVDVARFGDDETTIYKRTGLKITDVKKFRGQNTMKTAYDAWDMAGHDKSIPILVDVTGIGAGVVDRLRELGAKVIAIDFGGRADEKDLYANTITEMYFQFRGLLKEADIPHDADLIMQLSGRKYGYDNKNRYIVESKDNYKKRLGRSPDDADGILLCYYNPKSKIVSKDIQKEMAVRHRR